MQGVENATVTQFAQGEVGLGIDLQEGATKMVAGDYCCYNQGPAITSSKPRLDAALDALDTKVGVVILKSQMDSSLKVRHKCR